MKAFTRITALAAAAVLVAGVAGCSSEGAPAEETAAPETNSAVDPALAELVPAAIADRGTLRVASSFDAIPLAYYAPGEVPAGIIPEMIEGAAAKLGLEVEFQKMPIAGLIPALQADRIDVASSQISRTPDNDGVVNVLAFFETSTSLATQKDSEFAKATKSTDVCGARAGLTTGTLINEQIMDEIIADCQAAGLTPPEKMFFASYDAGMDALRAGQVDTYINSTPTLQATTDVFPELTVILKAQFRPRVTGIAVTPHNDFYAALAAAMDAMIADGSYQKVLDAHNVGFMAVDKVLVNGDIPCAQCNP